MKGITIDLEQGASQIMRLHKKVFGKLVRMRGVHVHNEDFLPRDIRRVGLLETMAFAYGIRDRESLRFWNRYRDLVVVEVRKEWVKHL